MDESDQNRCNPKRAKGRQTRFEPPGQCQAEIEFACPSSRQLRPRLPQTRNMAERPIGVGSGENTFSKQWRGRGLRFLWSYCWRPLHCPTRPFRAWRLIPPLPPHTRAAVPAEGDARSCLDAEGPRSHGLRFRPDCTPSTRDGRCVCFRVGVLGETILDSPLHGSRPRPRPRCGKIRLSGSSLLSGFLLG
jgi:hypothetical protein